MGHKSTQKNPPVFLVIRRILAAPKVRQQRFVAPAFVARGGPGVVVALLAAHVEQAVEGTGTPQDLEKRNEAGAIFLKTSSVKNWDVTSVDYQ